MKENIFSSFYSKVVSFFTSGKDLGDTESARDTASNRLKLVLMQDRSNLDGATMQKMREQLISVISKYIEIDTEALDLNLEGDGDEIALMLNIPVIRARTPEEIAEIEAKESEEKASEPDSSENETDESPEEIEDNSDTSDEESCEENNETEEQPEKEETLESEPGAAVEEITDTDTKPEEETEESTEESQSKKQKKNKNK